MTASVLFTFIVWKKNGVHTVLLRTSPFVPQKKVRLTGLELHEGEINFLSGPSR